MKVKGKGYKKLQEFQYRFFSPFQIKREPAKRKEKEES